MKNRVQALGLVLCVAVGLLIGARVVSAHHSDAVYDMTTVVLVEGTVTEHLLVNPHQIIRMTTKSPSGKTIVWQLVGANVLSVRKDGWTKDTLKPGAQVKVWGFPYRDGQPVMTWNMMIRKSDGKSLPISGAKHDKLARYLATYGKKELSPDEYQLFLKELSPEMRTRAGL